MDVKLMAMAMENFITTDSEGPMPLESPKIHAAKRYEQLSSQEGGVQTY